MPPLDDEAFDGCYRRVFPLVLAKCRRMLRGDAEALDVAQEVFVRLWKHRDLVNDEQALVSWLYRTATNLVIDRARRLALSRENLTHLGESLRLTPVDDSETRFASREGLRHVLSNCSEVELEVAILHRVDRLTQPEIAGVMNIGERTVRRLLRRFDERTGSLQEHAS